MSLSTVLENLSETSKEIARLDDIYLMTSGYDKPRYIDADTSIAGWAGLEDWGIDYFYRPSGAAVAGGSLTDTKYYSFVVVAVDTNWASVNGTYRMSNPTLPSVAVQASGSNLTVRLTVKAHPQQDYDDLVAEDACKERYIYASEGDSATAAESGPFSYVGKLSNNTDEATYDLTSFAAGTDEPYETLFQPPNARHCCSAYNIMWVAGGITENSGLCQVKQGTESESTASVAEQDSLSNIWRYTVSTWPSIDIYEGDLITVTGSGNAGNDVTKAKILHYNSTDKWVDVENENGVAEGSGGSVGFIQNHILGDSDTVLFDGMEGATFRFTGEPGYVIRKVYRSEKVLALETEYTDSVSADTNTAYFVTSKYGLYYSATRNAHWFPSANFISIPENATGLSYFDSNVLCFTAGHIYRIDAYSPGDGLFVVSEHVGTMAPKSIVRTNRGIYFFDGHTISVTDGTETQPSLSFKLVDFMDTLDWSRVDDIRGAWIPNEDKILWTFPTTDQNSNYYGILMNLINNDIMMISVPDAVEIWTGYDDTEHKPLLFHGTSGYFTNSGYGYIWKHDPSTEYDGLPSSSEVAGTVTDISNVGSNYITVQGDTDDFGLWTFGAVENNEGIPCTLVDTQGAWELNAIIKKMVENGDTTPDSFDVYFHADYDLSDIEVGDYFLLGSIPCSYGPKWFNFSSARYTHAVFDLKVCFEELDADAVMFIDWYVDMKADTSVSRNIVLLSDGDTEFSVNCAQGNVTSIGFRIRWYGPGRVNIQNYSLTFDTRR